MSRIRYPMLIESERGQAGLGDRFCLALLDNQSQNLLLRYYPSPQHSDWQVFEQQLRHLADLGAAPPWCTYLPEHEKPNLFWPLFGTLFGRIGEGQTRP